MAALPPPRPPADPGTFLDPWDHGPLIRLLAWLRQAHARLPLPPPAGQAGPGVPLDELFVPPRLSRGRGEGVDLFTALDHARSLAVLGGPGSGRTTLLASLVHALTDPGRNPAIDRLGRMVPLPVPLRVLPLRPDGRSFESLLAPLRALPFWAPGLDALLPELLARGQVLFVLDDFDFVQEPRLREALDEAILDGMWRWPLCTWIFASEAAAWEAAPLRSDALDAGPLPASLAGLDAPAVPTVPAWSVLPFDRAQARAQAERWSLLAGHADPPADAAAFLAAVDASPGAAAIADSPGFLALLGLVWAARAALPRDRAALLDWLVAAWISVLDEAPGAERVGAPLRRAWVEALARAAEAAPGGVVPFGRCVDLVREAARAGGHADPGEDAALRFVGGASVRPGVVCSRGVGLAFVRAEHQRLLAAVHLAADLAQPGDAPAEQAVRTLKAWARTPASHGELVAVFEVLSAQPGMAERVYRQVLGRSRARTLGELEDLGPLARALAGDLPAVPPRVKEAAGRLLSEAVGRWAAERRRVPPWAVDLEPLRQVEGLTSLDLSGCRAVRDLSPLAHFTQLERLDLRDCAAVEDLAPLEALEALRWADLRGCAALRSLEPLGRVGALRWLDLGRCTGLQDLSPLATLDGLQALVLHGCAEVEDLSPLSALRSLRALVVSDCPRVFDLRPLRLLPPGGRVWVRGSGVRVVPPDLRWEVIGLEPAPVSPRRDDLRSR
jgi:hypothetical protein